MFKRALLSFLCVGSLTHGMDSHDFGNTYDQGSGPGFAERTEGFSPLHRAAYFDDATIVRKMLSRGREDLEKRVDKSCSEFQGMNALHIAAQRGSIDIVEALLDAGADKEAGVDYHSWAGYAYQQTYRPLHFAVLGGYIRIVELLLMRGADKEAIIGTEASYWRGFRPLHMAAFRADTRLVELLLRHGADPRAVVSTNNHGWQGDTAAQIADYARAGKTDHNFDRIKR